MQTRSKKILNGILATRRIANAYLFAGGDNQIKLDSAKYFAQALNDTQKDPHPDIITVDAGSSTSIKIDQIRELRAISRYGPLEGKYQIIIINEADTLTLEAANSFLKLLEEPAPNVVFILISNRENALPQTILSRCQKITFEEPEARPPKEEAQELFNKLTAGKLHYIEASQSLSEAEDLKGLLQQLFVLFAEAKKTNYARIVLEILRGIEKRVNLKLAIDLLCLKLWKENWQLN